MEQFMENLRKEYEGLDLSDGQIIMAKSNDITPEQIKVFKENLKQLSIQFNELLSYLSNTFRNITESDGFKELSKQFIETQEKPVPTKRNKKGKPLKPWQKGNFYD